MSDMFDRETACLGFAPKLRPFNQQETKPTSKKQVADNQIVLNTTFTQTKVSFVLEVKPQQQQQQQ